jgi:hypothetical protein
VRAAGFDRVVDLLLPGDYHAVIFSKRLRIQIYFELQESFAAI